MIIEFCKDCKHWFWCDFNIDMGHKKFGYCNFNEAYTKFEDWCVKWELNRNCERCEMVYWKWLGFAHPLTHWWCKKKDIEVNFWDTCEEWQHIKTEFVKRYTGFGRMPPRRRDVTYKENPKKFPNLKTFKKERREV